MCPLKIKCVTLNFWGRARGYARGGGPLIVTLKKIALAAGEPTKIKGHDYGATPERYPKQLRVTPRPPPPKSPRMSENHPTPVPVTPASRPHCIWTSKPHARASPERPRPGATTKNHLFGIFFHEKPRKLPPVSQTQTWVSLNRPEAPETAAPPPSKLTGGMKQI